MNEYRWSVIALLGANLVPLVGVLFLGWDLFFVMLLYWLENAVVGYFNVFKIALSRSEVKPHSGAPASRPAAIILKVIMIPFFVVHYGLFWVVHGIFVIALFCPDGNQSDVLNVSHVMRALGPTRTGLLVTLSLLFLSHGISFLQNYIKGGEFRGAKLQTLMFLPYGRVVAMHLTILVGGFFVMLVDQFLPILALLVVAKTALDLWGHIRERRKCAPAPAAPETAPEPSA
jgi:hypothetical protein